MRYVIVRAGHGMSGKSGLGIVFQVKKGSAEYVELFGQGQKLFFERLDDLVACVCMANNIGPLSRTRFRLREASEYVLFCILEDVYPQEIGITICDELLNYIASNPSFLFELPFTKEEMEEMLDSYFEEEGCKEFCLYEDTETQNTPVDTLLVNDFQSLKNPKELNELFCYHLESLSDLYKIPPCDGYVLEEPGSKLVLVSKQMLDDFLTRSNPVSRDSPAIVVENTRKLWSYVK